MSKCNIVRDLLPLYDDGAVSEDTAKAVRRHLADCPGCSVYHKHINHVTRAMQDQESHNGYRYSGVVRRIRQRSLIELAAGAFILGVAIVGLIKASSRR